MAPTASATRDLRVVRRVKAAPARVYRALTSARELCQWWLDRAETDARSLGRVRMVWPEGLGWPEAEGVFVDLEPESKVAWLWSARRLPRGVPRLVTVFIERQARASVVTLVHAGFAAADDSLPRLYRERWEDCLEKLALYLEKGRVAKAELRGVGA